MLEAVVGLLVAAPAAFFAYLKTKKGRTQALSWIKRLFNVDVTADDLRASIENMSLALDAQGQSISYLTEQTNFLVEQLNQAKADLVSARKQLKELDALHKENRSLRKKVSDLETQVAALETELARRKKYTPKERRSDV